MSSTTRDPVAARAKAAEHVQRAQLLASAVDAFHQAADEIERSQEVIATASATRASALQSMRAAGLSITDIADLTGLSGSRIQALLRDDNGRGSTRPRTPKRQVSGDTE